MSQNEILDSLLLTLADIIFEAGNRRAGTFEASVEKYEPLRECLAGLIAEGSLSDDRGVGCYRFTRAGYARYRARIAALRALPR